MTRSLAIGLCAVCLILPGQRAYSQPPFGGTIFLDPDIITPADQTSYTGLADAGTGSRQVFDRRIPGWTWVNAFLFDASFDDGLSIEVQVNPELGTTDAARTEAAKYAEVIGRLPNCLRSDVETVWIHQGTEPFGGGNNNLLIHIGQADVYTASGILEETLVHEAAHTSLDADHADAPGWLSAQADDPTFISTYARDFPNREDIAESFLPYLALRHRADRIDSSLANTFETTMPNRISYFDGLSLDMYPIVILEPPVVTQTGHDAGTGAFTLTWSSRPDQDYAVEQSTNLVHWSESEVVASSGEETSHSIEPIPSTEGGAFFRIREVAAR